MTRALLPIRLFILSSLFFTSFFLGIQGAQAESKCESIFESRLYYDNQVLEKKDSYTKYHSQFFNIITERDLQKTWGIEKNTPKLFQKILPEGTGFLPYQLKQTQTPTTVKLEESALAFVVRASYNYKGTDLYTNVTVSKKIFDDNLTSPVKGLVGANAQAAILFLHGGGTRSTGGHVAEALVNHFGGLNIDVISPDLPWHGQGPREFLGHFKDEIRSLGAFAKKYIPENVPVFVWGHSWGAMYADELMRMTEDPDFSFHPNLKGVVIAAPGADPAPGKNSLEKDKEFVRRFDYTKKHLRHKFAELEADILEEPGVLNPVGALFAGLTMNQMHQVLPKHGGDKYIPGIMMVGEADPMVYVGNEDLFHAYYDKLSNLKTYYLSKLPLEKDPKGKEYRVGHLLRDYTDPEKHSMPVDFYYVKKFMAEQLNIDKLEKNPNHRQTIFTDLAHLWANSLSFRLWAEDYVYTHFRKTKAFGMIRGETEKLRKEMSVIFLRYLPPNRIANLITELKNEDSSQSLEYLKDEAGILFETFLQQRGLNKKLEQLLLGIKEADNKEEMKLLIQNLENDPSQFLPTKVTSTKSRSKELIQFKNAFGAFATNDLISIMKKLKVNKEDTEKILNQYYETEINEAKIRERVMPSSEDFLKKNPQMTEEEIKSIQNQISENIKERDSLSKIRKANSQMQREKYKEYKLGVKNVLIHTRLVKAAFAQGPLSPPESLKEAYAIHKKEFDALIDYQNNAEKIGLAISAKIVESGEEISTEEVNKILQTESNKEILERITKINKTYIQNRSDLRKKLITAIEKGDLGEEFQKHMIAMYGKDSKGEFPTGDDSLYVQLQTTTEELASLEAEAIKTKKKEGELFNSYYELLPYEPIGKITKHKLSDILSGIKNSTDIPAESEKDIINFLTENKFLFEKFYANWKAMHSKTPPAFPSSRE